ncbi:MAG: hypothetical protein HOW73_22630 [Polyangiaceae bacterium]|nr:hypothetical protein [Polyangiaceae bacterium]
MTHHDGVPIARVERCAVTQGSLAQDEIAEFLDELDDCKPETAAKWLRSYLPQVATIYSFQHLSGCDERDGDLALRAVRDHIWARGDAILQADAEGFSNEDGYHILWQFDDAVTGPWMMAVLVDDVWVPFKTDLANRRHRQAFLKGLVPPGAKLV